MDDGPPNRARDGQSVHQGRAAEGERAGPEAEGEVLSVDEGYWQLPRLPVLEHVFPLGQSEST